MKTKLTQTLGLLLFVGIIDVFSVSAQYKINTLVKGQELRTNQGLRSANGVYNAILQSDGNFCLYKNGDQFIKCSMTVQNGKKGDVLRMQTDGNLVIYNDKNTAIWATDTYRGSSAQKGAKLVLENNGNLILYNSSGKPIYNFKNGTNKETKCVGCPK